MTASDFRAFLREYTDVVEPLNRRIALAYWDASISGRREDFERYAELEIELQRVHADRDAWRRLCAWRDADAVRDPLERRVLDVLVRKYRRHQADPSMQAEATRRASELANRFFTFRARVGERELTSNEVREVLRTSTDEDERRRVWEADKRVGEVVRDDLLELVRLRNAIARSIGFENFHVMSMRLAEQDPEEILAMFDRLDVLTADAWRRARARIGEALARRHGVAPDELRPWHFEDPFFQEAPRLSDVDVDAVYRGRDVVELVARFFDGVGLDVRDILARSDLYEKPGKDQHAYCMDIDRAGDVRILANVRDDESWTGTMLHELGHAVYDRGISPELPWVLREHAHIFVTEAVAMFFGRLSRHPGWIQAMLGIDDAERDRLARELVPQQRIAQLVFARWCQVMMRFERALYASPDADLDALWWDLVERHQGVARPDGRHAPDWAAKIHVVSAPVYYHNYMLGELLASQMTDALRRDGVVDAAAEARGYAGASKLGAWFTERLFRHGSAHPWPDAVRLATGEPLDAASFARAFVDDAPSAPAGETPR